MTISALPRFVRPLLDAATTLIEPLLQSIDHLGTQIKTLDKRLEELARTQYPDTDGLRQSLQRNAYDHVRPFNLCPPVRRG